MTLQCQRCSVESLLTVPLYGTGSHGKGLPWRCPKCHAQHRITTSGGFLENIELEDRYAFPNDLSCPPDVLSDFREAVTAFNAGAPRAAVVMVRRALENVCDALNAPGGRLADKIKHLAAKGIFDDGVAAAATAMRLFGNYGAHPKDDLLDGANDAHAEMALRIAERFLRDFTVPRK
jgi:hypothetical protein